MFKQGEREKVISMRSEMLRISAMFGRGAAEASPPPPAPRILSRSTKNYTLIAAFD
ncbi:hypothetical protein PX699_03250 [Sphingobium sp. H39-3-25]|uniref:hypothetical protein n=1 Tax=Sphingobium arseniciresistens TaxID=3030834 RepID=UPI0023B96708|nr:hypothetical protein [Sphingobium arseniciresistens]